MASQPKKSARDVTRGALQGAVAGGVGGAPAGTEAAALGAALGALAGGGKELVALAVDRYRTSTDRLIEARDLEKARALDAHHEELAEAVDELRDAVGDEEDLATALLARLQAWDEAWNRTADSKKARVITAALVNSLDPELYEEGLSVYLMGLLADLDYPEIRLLRQLGDCPKDHPKTWGDMGEGTLKRHMVLRLQAVRHARASHHHRRATAWAPYHRTTGLWKAHGTRLRVGVGGGC